MTRDRWQAFEADACLHRIAELRENPVQGNFDAEHLKEINRRIFQDLPGAGLTHVTPGEFRKEVSETGDWRKRRAMEGLPPSTVAYSRMDADALTRLDRTLERADPEKLKSLDLANFTREIGEIYTELDYVHPFDEGDSRTLREFTKQLANESGYDIDWQCFDRGEAGRNILYIARDISVNTLALPHIRSDEVRREVTFMLDQYGGNRDLPDLLRDAVSEIGADHAFDAAEKRFSERLKKAMDAPESRLSREAIALAAQTIREIYQINHTREEAQTHRQIDHDDDYGL